MERLKIDLTKELSSNQNIINEQLSKLIKKNNNTSKLANPNKSKKKKKINNKTSSKILPNNLKSSSKLKSEKNTFIFMLNNKNVINNFNEKNKGKKLNSLKTRSKDEKAHILTYKGNTTENNEKNKKKEDLNDLPYSKAIKMDKRNIFHTFFSFAIEKFDIINIFLVDSRIKIILFEEFIISLVINFFFNALLYTDDVVSNKYHNNGELDLIVTLSLSIVSNIVTSIFCYYTKYSRGIDERMKLIVDIRYDVQYFKNLTKFLLFLKIKFICFFIGQLLSFATCIYYLVIFCILYKRSQESLIINYGYSLIESIIISFGIALIIVITRKIGLSCLNKNFYNVSKYINNKL